MTSYAPPPPVPAGYQLKKKKRIYQRVWFWLLIAVVVVIILIVTTVSKAVDKAVHASHTVTYQVTGTAKNVHIDYNTSDGSGKSVSQSLDVKTLPWSLTVAVKGDLSDFDVIADQVDVSGATGTLACNLTVDGKVASTDQAAASSVGTVDCYGNGYQGK